MSRAGREEKTMKWGKGAQWGWGGRGPHSLGVCGKLGRQNAFNMA